VRTQADVREKGLAAGTFSQQMDENASFDKRDALIDD
jgi:hypothetical protein